MQYVVHDRTTKTFQFSFHINSEVILRFYQLGICRLEFQSKLFLLCNQADQEPGMSSINFKSCFVHHFDAVDLFHPARCWANPTGKIVLYIKVAYTEYPLWVWCSIRFDLYAHQLHTAPARKFVSVQAPLGTVEKDRKQTSFKLLWLDTFTTLEKVDLSAVPMSARKDFWTDFTTAGTHFENVNSAFLCYTLKI